MLSILGFLIIVIMLALVLTKKTSIHFGLTVVPLIIALFAGFSFIELGEYMGSGLSSIAQTGIMLTFAILFFGILYDAGLFDPIIKNVIRISSGDPVKITIGTVIVAAVAHLDGSGSSTYLIAVSSLLPIYLSLKMRPITLVLIVGLTAGVMNIVPWGGPTIRAATSLDIPITELFNPLIPVVGVGMFCVIMVAIILGRQERKRIAKNGIVTGDQVFETLAIQAEDPEKEIYKRPKLFIPNLLITILVIATLVSGKVPLAIPFVLGVPLILLLNYRDVKMQQNQIEAHAKGAIYTASIIFSAGIFIGILSGTGMIEAMATTLASSIPQSAGGFLPVILAVMTIPLSLLFDPDSFYFGVLPVLSATAENFGIAPEVMARAALMGHTTLGAFISPLIGSSWLLAGLAGVDFGDMQKKGLPYAFAITIIMTISAVLFGLI